MEDDISKKNIEKLEKLKKNLEKIIELSKERNIDATELVMKSSSLALDMRFLKDFMEDFFDEFLDVNTPESLYLRYLVLNNFVNELYPHATKNVDPILKQVIQDMVKEYFTYKVDSTTISIQRTGEDDDDEYKTYY